MFVLGKSCSVYSAVRGSRFAQMLVSHAIVSRGIRHCCTQGHWQRNGWTETRLYLAPGWLQQNLQMPFSERLSWLKTHGIFGRYARTKLHKQLINDSSVWSQMMAGCWIGNKPFQNGQLALDIYGSPIDFSIGLPEISRVTLTGMHFLSQW